MQPESRKLLLDMLDFANSIVEATQNRTLNDLKNDKLLRAGIYHWFTVIGEALTQLHQFDKDTGERISESPRIIGFRNQIVHGYAKIEDEITWRIIQTKLPVLKRELEQLLAE